MSQNLKIFVIAALIFLLSFSIGMFFFNGDGDPLEQEKLQISPQLMENNLVVPSEHMDVGNN